jgi:hypothetical protein
MISIPPDVIPDARSAIGNPGANSECLQSLWIPDQAFGLSGMTRVVVVFRESDSRPTAGPKLSSL